MNFFYSYEHNIVIIITTYISTTYITTTNIDQNSYDIYRIADMGMVYLKK